MAKQSFRNTIAFLIAGGDMYNIECVQWNGCAEGLAETLMENASSNMIFMGTQFSFDKTSSDIAITIANIIIRMLQGKWEYDCCFKDCIDLDLTVSRLNQAKKVIKHQMSLEE